MLLLYHPVEQYLRISGLSDFEKKGCPGKTGTAF
jgi:hypothetical protein